MALRSGISAVNIVASWQKSQTGPDPQYPGPFLVKFLLLTAATKFMMVVWWWCQQIHLSVCKPR
jgi:hypothetical protein